MYIYTWYLIIYDYMVLDWRVRFTYQLFGTRDSKNMCNMAAPSWILIPSFSDDIYVSVQDFNWATKKTLLLSIESWMVNRDPYNGLL